VGGVAYPGFQKAKEKIMSPSINPGATSASSNAGTGSGAQPNFVEEPAFYLAVIALTAGQSLTNVPVNIDRDSDFCLTGINGSQTGTFTFNFRLPSGRFVGNQQIKNTDFVGTANQPNAIGPPPIYRAGSVGPQLDITDTSGGNNNVQLVFTGIRRLRTQ
jgi:hypothetical protein